MFFKILEKYVKDCTEFSTSLPFKKSIDTKPEVNMAAKIMQIALN